MKKLLFAAYIVLVVIASLAARAEEVVVLDPHIEFDRDQEALRIAARFPDPCTSNEEVVLTPTGENGVFFIDVIAYRKSQYCPDNNGSLFRSSFDIRALKFELQRHEKSLDGTYTLVSRNGQFAEVIDFSKYDFSMPIPHPYTSGLLNHVEANASETGDDLPNWMISEAGF